MTLDDFLKAIQAMVAIPAPLRERLTQLASHMTEEERKQTMESLLQSNQKIETINTDIAGALDEGIAGIDQYRKKELSKQSRKSEAQDQEAADKIFDDDSSAPKA